MHIGLNFCFVEKGARIALIPLWKEATLPQ
jgi:hypothetical protein